MSPPRPLFLVLRGEGAGPPTGPCDACHREHDRAVSHLLYETRRRQRTEWCLLVALVAGCVIGAASFMWSHHQTMQQFPECAAALRAPFQVP